MMRISLLCLCLCTTAWASGCCHGYYSRNSECDEGFCCNQPRKQPRHRHCKADRGSRGGRQNGCDYANNDCCGDSCCGDGGYSGGMSMDGAPMMQGAGCSGGNCSQGASSGGCASGNCGNGNGPGNGTGMSSNAPVYGGMPFNPGDGWTVQSTTSHPVGNEPFPVPANTVPTPVTPPATSSQGWTTPSSVPNPAPVPPPVSFNRR